MKRIPKQTDATPTVQTAQQQTGSLPALPPDLAEVGGYTPGSVPLPESQSFPWIGFWTKKSGRAADVVQALGALTDGTPYLCTGDNYYHIMSYTFVTLAETRYWAAIDEDNDAVRVWMQEQPFGKKYIHNGKPLSIKDCVQCILLLLPGMAPLHADLQPAQIAVCDFRGTKAPAVIGHLKELEKTFTPEWARSNGDVAGKVPPRFRVVSNFVIVPKSSRNGGFGYQLAKNNTTTIGLAQIEAIAKWHADENAQEEFARAQEIYMQRVQNLRDQAAQADKAGL